MSDKFCPDGGKCHHNCPEGTCFRVATCCPLSGVYHNDRWPPIIAHLGDAWRDYADASRDIVVSAAMPLGGIGPTERERVIEILGRGPKYGLVEAAEAVVRELNDLRSERSKVARKAFLDAATEAGCHGLSKLADLFRSWADNA